MKIGLMAFSTKTGLGYQTRDFYSHIHCDKVLIPDISKNNLMPVDHSWVSQPRITNGMPGDKDLEWLVDDMDVVFVAETPLNHYLFDYAKRKGVKTVLQYNYEFLPFFKRPELALPDILAAPTLWNIEKVRQTLNVNTVYWPVPVDTAQIPFRQIDEVKTFVHIVGRPAAYDRNGTVIFLLAALHLRKKGYPFNFHVYVQRPKDARANEHFQPVERILHIAQKVLGNSLTIFEDVEDNTQMYKTGEILVLPRRYGGLCLPMWEALSAGMPVLMPDIDPNNTILPQRWLYKAVRSGSFMAHTNIDLYSSDILKLVETMLLAVKNIDIDSKFARTLAEGMSWDVQKQKYMDRFEKLVHDKKS